MVVATALLAAPRRLFAQAATSFLDVRSFGVRLDGSDSTAALQRALDAAGQSGRTLYLPAGKVGVSGSGRACLTLRRAVRLVGDGGLASCIVPAPSVPRTTAVVLVAPDPGFRPDFLTFEKFGILDPSNGMRGGGDAVLLDTSPSGAILPKATFRDLFIGLGGGLSIRNVNERAKPAGTFYGATIENCQLRGGISLEGAGDSNRIVGNILTGPGIGVYARLTPGSGMLSIIDNNITSDAGALDVAGDTIIMERNLIEHYEPGSPGMAVVQIGTDRFRSGGAAFVRNSIAASGKSRAVALIRAVNCDGLDVSHNVLAWGFVGRKGIEIGAGCRRTYVAGNIRNAQVPPPGDEGVATVIGAEDAAIAK